MDNRFKLAFFVKINIVMFLLVTTPLTVLMFITNLHNLVMIALAIALLLFEIYEIRVLFAISRSHFKEIIIDNNKSEFLLNSKNNEIFVVPFDNIDEISMTKAEVLRGVACGHVSIKTNDNRHYGLTISNITSFSVALPDKIKKTLIEYIYYRPSWNNMD